jgi:hypothetical protein
MTQLDSEDSYADRQYEAELRRHLVRVEERRRISSGEDISVAALQQWALDNIYGTGFRSVPTSNN